MKGCVKRIINAWVTIYQTTQLNISVTWLQEPQNSGDLDRLLGASKLAILYLFFSTCEEGPRWLFIYNIRKVLWAVLQHLYNYCGFISGMGPRSLL